MIRGIRYLVTLGIVLTAVNAEVPRTRERVGVPEDWSHHRLIIGGQAALQHPELATREPRIMHAFLQQFRSKTVGNLSGASAAMASAAVTQ